MKPKTLALFALLTAAPLLASAQYSVFEDEETDEITEQSLYHHYSFMDINAYRMKNNMPLMTGLEYLQLFPNEPYTPQEGQFLEDIAHEYVGKNPDKINTFYSLVIEYNDQFDSREDLNHIKADVTLWVPTPFTLNQIFSNTLSKKK